jgi:hypothetical protein
MKTWTCYTMTDKTIRALELLEKHERLTPRQFAEKMWPDAPAWKKCSNVGHGSTTGVGITRAGGCYLARLRKLGLTRQVFARHGHYAHHEITEQGSHALRAAKRPSTIEED